MYQFIYTSTIVYPGLINQTTCAFKTKQFIDKPFPHTNKYTTKVNELYSVLLVMYDVTFMSSRLRRNHFFFRYLPANFCNHFVNLLGIDASFNGDFTIRKTQIELCKK